MDEFERWRDEFPILSRTVYMISNSLGAMPRQAARDLAEYAETWATRGVRAWEERWWEMPLEIGNKIAWIIGAPARHREHARERDDGAHGGAVVGAAHHFPTPAGLLGDGLPFDGLPVSAPGGCRLRAAHRAGGGRPVGLDRTDDRRDRRADGGRRVLARAVPNVVTSWTPPRSSRTRTEVGATVILDTYQSAGIVPLDVSALQVDFAVGGCLKWLCGGPGNAFLYTRPDLLKTARPAFTGWLSRRAPFAFDIDADDSATTRCA